MTFTAVNQAGSSPYAVQKPLILVVDDSPEVLGLISQALGSSYDLVLLGGARPAMQLLHEVKVDLLITDIRMPDGDGIELADYAMARARTPIVFLSGFVDEQTAAAVGSRSTYLLNKPFPLARLFTVVREALGDRTLALVQPSEPSAAPQSRVLLPAAAYDVDLQAGDALVLDAADPVALHGGELICYRSRGHIRVARYVRLCDREGVAHAALWGCDAKGEPLDYEVVPWENLMGVVVAAQRQGSMVAIPPRPVTRLQRIRRVVRRMLAR